jgi:hypothetical protein
LSFAGALSNALPVVPDSILTDDPAAVPDLRLAFPGASIQHRP